MCAPLLFLTFYCSKFNVWQEVKFDWKYGSALDGLKKNQKPSIIFYVAFIQRRIMFSIVVIYYLDFLFVQIFFHEISTLLICSYLLFFSPFEDPFLAKLEIFNEMTCLILIYNLYCFTNANYVEKTKENNGVFDFSFMILFSGNIAVHLYFIIISQFRKIKKSCMVRISRFNISKR